MNSDFRVTPRHLCRMPRYKQRSAWFIRVLALMVYLIFAMTLYLLPPLAQGNGSSILHR
jgi:hypothetical protein